VVYRTRAWSKACGDMSAVHEFDKAVRRKPLAFAADAVSNSPWISVFKMAKLVAYRVFVSARPCGSALSRSLVGYGHVAVRSVVLFCSPSRQDIFSRQEHPQFWISGVDHPQP
jgi:hypothetical protein